MATGQVLFQRFYYSKSFVKHNMEVGITFIFSGITFKVNVFDGVLRWSETSSVADLGNDLRIQKQFFFKLWKPEKAFIFSVMSCASIDLLHLLKYKGVKQVSGVENIFVVESWRLVRDGKFVSGTWVASARICFVG